MICEKCGRDNVPHLRYDPITQEPIGCIECMPEVPLGMQNAECKMQNYGGFSDEKLLPIGG